MLLSYNWLSEYVDLTGISPEDLAERLTFAGIEVEAVHARNTGFTQVVVGHVKEVEPHPNADRLRVCTVDVGEEEPLSIVCGAANVAPGQYVPVALVGARLPGGIKIKRTKLRGVLSEGMICSAQELGIPEKVVAKNQVEGILVLPKTDVGTDVDKLLGLDDYVLELELTPNRADCLSMWGLAYEVAAILDRKLKLEQPPQILPEEKEIPVELILDAKKECPTYAAQIVSGIKIAPSPQWMQNRLMAAGIRPINNVVDITNYVMLEMGQPLHAFDLDKLAEPMIRVRLAHPGETVTTLDGVTRACPEGTLLITDGSKPIAIAGVMGGHNSEVTSKTTTVLLESALFDPGLVRTTSRTLGLRTEASNRFEKGVDPERILLALRRAVQLLVEIAGGTVISRETVEVQEDVEDITIQLRHERLTRLLGVQLKAEEVEEIFRRLRFSVKTVDHGYRVEVPTRRLDITQEVDLIEEVGRLYGYDRIPATLPWGTQSTGGLSKEQRLQRTIRHLMLGLGFSETITYTLTSPEELRKVGRLGQDLPLIRLSLPMSDERTVLRTSLLPHLIQTARYNVHRQQENIALFEMGHVFITQEKQLSKLPEERLELAALITGNREPIHWQGIPSKVDFFMVKGMLEFLFTRLGVEGITYHGTEIEGFHPGRTAEIRLDDRLVGLLGQLHPEVSKAHDLDETYVFQLELLPLFKAAGRKIHFSPLPRYPEVTRDLAIVVDADLPAAEIKETIYSEAGELLKTITVFDLFSGEQIEAGKKSIAFNLVFQHPERTLTDDEVNQLHNKIVSKLETTYGAKLRG